MVDELKEIVHIKVVETIKGKPRVAEGARVGLSPVFDTEKGSSTLKTGVSRADWEKFYKETFGDYDKFYAEFTVMLTNQPRQFDMSEIKNKLVVALLRNHPWVAKDSGEITQNTLYLLYDEVEEAKKENKAFDYELKAYKYLYDMSANEKAQFLKLFGYKRTESVNPEVISKRLKDKAKEDPKLFVETYEDKAKDIRIMIEDLLQYGIVKRIGGVFYFGKVQDGIPMGSTIEQAVEFIRDPKNNALVDQLIKMLDTKKATK